MKPILFANRAFGPVAGLADGPELVESRGTGDAAAGFLAPIGAGDAVAVVHIHLHIEDSIPVGAVEDRQGRVLDQQDVGVVVVRHVESLRGTRPGVAGPFMPDHPVVAV